MIQKKKLYEDVVLGNQPTKQPPDKSTPIEQKDKKDPHTEERQSGKEAKKSGKDEQSQPSLEARAEKLAEDPYATNIDEHMGGDTKEDNTKAENNGKSTKKELDVLASRADKILFRAKGLFPFDFFPNTITIDANKVNIIISTFFLTDTVTSVLLKEIMDVRVETTLFLGKLIIDYGPHPLKVTTVYIPSLWKKDALKAKEIIEGILVIYRSENINTTELKPEETLDEVKDIGKIEEREA